MIDWYLHQRPLASHQMIGFASLRDEELSSRQAYQILRAWFKHQEDTTRKIVEEQNRILRLNELQQEIARKRQQQEQDKQKMFILRLSKRQQFAKVVIPEMTECATPEAGRDAPPNGGCTWGLSHASRVGKFSTKDEIRREDARLERKRVVDHPEWVRPLETRTQRTREAEELVSRLRKAHEEMVAELARWEMGRTSEPVAPRKGGRKVKFSSNKWIILR